MCLAAFAARADLWVTGYYPGWEQASMAASNLDFTILTHVIHFSLEPNSDGSLNSSDNGITAGNSADVVTRAHAAGQKVLVCVGGADTEAGFQGATSTANLPTFISNLTNFMATRGYDGIDIDWEPLPISDAPQYTNFVNGLRAVLNGLPQPELLTAAVGAYPPYGDPPTAQYVMFASLQNQFDQINIMTYDLSGPWPGWVTWFNSPIYDGGYHFASSGGLVPSVKVAVSNFLSQGVSAGKLGVGAPFYGYLWTTNGITQPRQAWPANSPPAVTATDYATIISSYYQPGLYHWDDSAQAAYLSLTNVNPAYDAFLSYDDTRACQAKVSYVRNHGLGGVMIWELAQDYFPAQPAGLRNPLLQSIKQALATPAFTGIQITNQQAWLEFTSLPLGSYLVQWTTNLSGLWNTLLTTNMTGAGGVLQVTDPGPMPQSQRFYRVRTPP